MVEDSWELVHASREWGEWPDDALIRFVKGWWPGELGGPTAGRTVLELGCGAGANLRLFAEEGLRIAGVDISTSAISRARARLNRWCPDWVFYGPSQEAALIEGSVEDLKWDDESFDLVVDLECIYCLDQASAKQVYMEAWRVATVGGWLFVRTFATDSFIGNEATEIDRNRFRAVAGPLAGLPPTRLTPRSEVGDLLGPWTVQSVDTIHRTIEGGPSSVRELIIVATKEP